MVRPKAPKRALQAIIDLEETTVVDSSDPLAPSYPAPASPPGARTTYPLEPLSPDWPEDTETQKEPTPRADTPKEDDTPKGDAKFKWNREMIVAMVECIHTAFKRGRLSDGGLKKELWNEVAATVRSHANGRSVSGEQCKNKWGSDVKEKWKHFKILGGLSGWGYNNETQLYENDDYIWESLNKQYKHITWHKSNVMYCKEELEEILHDSQANGQGAFAGSTDGGADGGVIDPRLRDLSTPVSRASPGFSIRPNSDYGKSKKRAQADLSDDEDMESQSSKRPTPKTTTSKPDLGAALLSLSEQLKLNREHKENQKTVSQQAITLLEKYGDRLSTMEFFECCTFLKDEGNAGLFLAISDPTRRDRWLEISVGIQLAQEV